jgi:hypothetical protein
VSVNRFYYVAGPGMGVLHVMRGPRVEGTLTDCGRPVSTAWVWMERRSTKRAVCRKCVPATARARRDVPQTREERV